MHQPCAIVMFEEYVCCLTHILSTVRFLCIYIHLHQLFTPTSTFLILRLVLASKSWKSCWKRPQ